MHGVCSEVLQMQPFCKFSIQNIRDTTSKVCISIIYLYSEYFQLLLCIEFSYHFISLNRCGRHSFVNFCNVPSSVIFASYTLLWSAKQDPSIP